MTIKRPHGFADVIPYSVPDSLDDLHGPVSGVVSVPPHISTAPDPSFDLDNASQRWAMYSAVVRDGTAADHKRYLDSGLLLALWAELNLPKRCREQWVSRFPELSKLGLRMVSV
ncbi:MAG: hypothetical protein LBM23_08545 [Propionibacteriaceae bacterium]|jgi:hypothetical protein|nr:hypothetical protein [Propionibacteriaceae bacterium]